MKGITATRQTKAGNPWDQAALLVDQLEAAGFDADIASGRIVASGEELNKWLGTETTLAAYNVIDLSMDGFATHDSGANTVEFTHAWVRVKVPTATGLAYVDLDPSWKFKVWRTGIEVNLAGVNGTFDEFDFLSLPEDNKQLPLEFYEDQVMQYLVSNYPGTSLADVSKQGPIIHKSFDTIPAGLGEGVSIIGAPTIFDSINTILSNNTLAPQFTHQVDISFSREIDTASRAFSLDVSGSAGDTLPDDSVDSPSSKALAPTQLTGTYTIGGAADNGYGVNLPLVGRKFVGTIHRSLGIGNHIVTGSTRIKVSIDSNAAGHQLLLGLDTDRFFDNDSQESIFAYTLQGGSESLVFSLNTTGFTADTFVLGLRHFDHNNNVQLDTGKYVDVTEIVVYEESSGTATVLLDATNAKNIVQQGNHYLSLDTSSLNFQVVRQTVLEVEFKDVNTGQMHAIGWDVDDTSTNDSNQDITRHRLAGSSTEYPLLTPVETLADGYKKYRVNIGLNVNNSASELLSRLIFYTEGTTSTESWYRNLRLVTDFGDDGEFLSASVVVPQSSLSTFHIVYTHSEKAPLTDIDDTYRPWLWIDDVWYTPGDLSDRLQSGDNAIIELEHFAPTALVKAPTDPADTRNTIYDRTVSFSQETGEIVAIGFDANQHSRESLEQLHVELLAALDDSTSESDYIEDVDELLSYTAAKYWHDFNQDNEIIRGLTNTVGLQQSVGSGIVSAKPDLLVDENGNFVIDHLNYAIAPVDMGVDLPNATGGFIDRTSGLVNDEAFQLLGFNASALEHTVLEDTIDSASVSTMKGLRNAYQRTLGVNASNNAIIDDAILVFERVGSTIIYQGEWHEGSGQPNLNQTKTTGQVEAMLFNHQPSDGGTNTIATTISGILGGTTGNFTGDLTILVPRGKSKVGDWIGSVYVVETASRRVYAIAKEGGSVTNGGFSGNVYRPINELLPITTFKNQTFAGDPVNVANGNMFRDDVDIVFPSLGVSLNFARHYDSKSQDDIGLGVGWTYSFGDVLFLDPEDTNQQDLIWLTSSGQRHTFEWNGSGYDVPAALHGKFSEDASFYYYKDKSGMEYHFEKPTGTETENGLILLGRLKQQIDNIDNGVTINYDTDAHFRSIQSVQDVHTYDRRLEFDYNADDVISQIRKVDLGATVDTWGYGYLPFSVSGVNSDQRLVTAVAPQVTAVDVAGNEAPTTPTLAYGYYGTGASKGVIETITEPTGETHTYEYYPNGRVFRVTDSLGHTQTFNYNLFRNLTEFTDENGHTETYIHQDNGLLERQIHDDRTRQIFTWGDEETPREFLMTSSTDEVGATTSFTYYDNAADFRDRELFQSTEKHFTDAMGTPLPGEILITTQFDYFTPSAKPHMIKLDEIVFDPGAADIKTSLTYDSVGRLLTTTDDLDNVTKQTYNGNGPLSSNGLLASVVSPRGNDTGDPTADNAEFVSWEQLTDITLTGDTLSVRVSFDPLAAGKLVIADAIRIERISGDFPYIKIIDDDGEFDGDFVVSGTTTNAGQFNLYYGSDRTLLFGTGDTATWTFEGLEPGEYRVYATWFEGYAPTNRWHEVPYEVVEGSSFTGTPTKLIDQTIAPDDLSAGFETVFTYDAAGNVTSATTDGLPAVINTYDHNGSLLTSLDPAGVVSGFTYDVLGRQLTAENYPADLSVPVLTSSFAYDASGRVRFSTDPLGRVTEFQYDLKGNLTKQISADGTEVSFEYDSVGNLTSQIDRLGRTTRFVYDNRNRLMQTIYADGASERFGYNSVGQVTATLDALERETQFTYDAVGRLLSTTNAATDVATNEYDLLGRLVSSVDYKNQETQFKYDDLGRLVETRVLPTNPSDPLPALSTVDYDAAGNVVRVATYDTVGLAADATAIPADPRDLITSANLQTNRVQVVETRYDSLNRPVETYFPSGQTTNSVRTVYDNAGRVLYSYDELGRKTELRYDQYGRLSETVAPDPDGTGSLSSPITHFEYDAASNQTAVIDPRGNRTELEYDVFNRVVTTTNALGGRRHAVYDAAGQLVAAIDALGRASYTLYDERGRVKQIRSADPDGSGPQLAAATEFEYDAVGNLTSQTDPQGFETVFEYNDLNRLVREEYQESVILDDGEPGFEVYTGTETSITSEVGFAGDYTTAEAIDADSRGSAKWIFTGLSAGAYRIGATWDNMVGGTSDNGLFRVLLDGGVEDYFQYNVDQTQPADDFYRFEDGVLRGWEDVNDGVNPLLVISGLGPHTLEVRHASAKGTVLIADAVRLERTVTREFSYDANGNLQSETDTLGRTTDYTYDELNRQITVTLPDPDDETASGGANGALPWPQTTTIYDGFGNVLRMVEDRGGQNRTTEWTYDHRNRLLTETLDAGGSEEVTAEFTYDAVGNLTNQIEAAGGIDVVTEFEYDDLNRLTREIRRPQGDNSVIVFTDYEYDGNNNLVQSDDHIFQFVPFVASHNVTTEFSYDALNRQTSVTRDAGRSLETTSFVEYDAVGNVVGQTDALGRTSHSQYDRLDRLVKTTDPDPDGATGPLAASETMFKYDDVGNLVSQTNGEGETDEFAYDPFGRLVSSTDALGNETLSTYDTEGTRLSFTDPNGNTTSYAYDRLNRLKTETITLGGGDVSRTYEYDAQGNLLELFDRNGLRRKFIYDRLDRQITTLWYDVDDISVVHSQAWTYDALGRVTGNTDDGTGYANSQSFEYDHLGRVVSKMSGESSTPSSFVEQRYVYDVLDGGGQFIRTNYYQYVDDGQGGQTLFASSTSFTDRLGRTTKIEESDHPSNNPVGKQIEFTYDAADQLTGIERTADGGLLQFDTNYAYDQAGRVTDISHLRPLAPSPQTPFTSYAYQYDQAHRIIEQTTTHDSTIATFSGVPSSQTKDFVFDDAGQLTADGTDTFIYDDNGNRTSGGTVTGEHNRLTEDADYTYTYDAEGNLIRRDDKTGFSYNVYQYDHRNRLTEVRKIVGTFTTTSTYRYNALDQLVYRRVESADSPIPPGFDPVVSEEHFVHDGDRRALTLDNQGVVRRRYVHGPITDQAIFDEVFDELGQQSDLLAFAGDHLQTTRAVLDGQGDVHRYIDYDSSGNVTEQRDEYGNLITGGIVPPGYGSFVYITDVLFAGRLWDNYAQLYNNRDRWYDPNSGRFVSEDPIGFADGPNPYRYAGNDPINFRDPSGLTQAGNPLNNLFSGPINPSFANQYSVSSDLIDTRAFSGPVARPSSSLSNFSDYNSVQRVLDQPQLFDVNQAYFGNLAAQDRARAQFHDPIIVGANAVLSNPRVQGGLKVLQGAGEAGIATGLTLVPDATVTKVGAVVLGAKAIDSFQAGGRQLWTGIPVDTLTQTAATNAALGLGASQRVANIVGGVADAAPAVVGGIGLIRRSLALADDGARITATAGPVPATPVSPGIVYGELDVLSRPTGVSARLTRDVIRSGSPASQLIRPAGFQGGAAGHARGHLLGAQLGGSGRDVRNLVTLQQFPINTPVMRGFESQIRAAIRSGESINLTVTPLYRGSNVIPRGITIEGVGSGGFRIGVSVLNSPGFP